MGRLILCRLFLIDAELFDSETYPSEFKHITLNYTDRVLVLFELVRAELDLFRSGQFFCTAVLQTDDLPRLLKVIKLLIHFAICLIKSLLVINPIRAALIYYGNELLVRIGTAKLWHDVLQSVFVTNKKQAP